MSCTVYQLSATHVVLLFNKDKISGQREPPVFSVSEY